MELNNENFTEALLNTSENRRDVRRGRRGNPRTDPVVEERLVANLLNEQNTTNIESGGITSSQSNFSDSQLNITLFLPHQDNNLQSQEARKNKIPDFAKNQIYFARHNARAISAPARPKSDLEKFKASNTFAFIENTAVCASQMILRSDWKYDLDTNEGQRNCKKLLEQIEFLCGSLKVKCQSRDYRSRFSQAYQILFRENSLCYLTEIIDSAQESKHDII